MILSEDYKVSYNLFLAEKELRESLYKDINSLILSESSYESICEGMNDTIMNYLNKVTANIQEVWEKFLATVGTDNHKAYLTKSAEKIKTANPRFTINNFPNYDVNIFLNYKVQRYNRQTMTDELKTQKAFIQRYYSSLYSERNNMNVMMLKNVARGYINIRCDKTVLVKSYNFCSTGFYEARQSIEQDIAIINESIDGISRALQTIQTTQESNMLYESMIFEALNSGIPQNKATKMSFTDNDGSKVDPSDKSTQMQTSFINQITNYMKISTQIISAKMKVLTQMYKSHLDIIKHYVDITQYGDPVPNNQVQKVQTQAQQSTN